MKVRAAVLEEFGKPLVVQEVDLAEPKAGEVLVRLEACGVCHTDLYTASGADPTGYAPCVLGHEGAGVVERVGPEVSLVAPGDHVITLFAPECGTCVHCRSPRTNRCVAIREQQGLGYLPDGTARFSRDGEELLVSIHGQSIEQDAAGSRRAILARIELTTEAERWRWLNTCFLVGEGEIDEERENWWLDLFVCVNEQAQGPPAIGAEPPERFRQRGPSG